MTVDSLVKGCVSGPARLMNKSPLMKESVSPQHESVFAKAAWALQHQLLEVTAPLPEEPRFCTWNTRVIGARLRPPSPHAGTGQCSSGLPVLCRLETCKPVPGAEMKQALCVVFPGQSCLLPEGDRQRKGLALAAASRPAASSWLPSRARSRDVFSLPHY